MSKKELAKRYILTVIAMFFMAIGVAFSKRSNLGVSPISSVANVLSIKFNALSMGTWLFIWSIMMVLLQIAILRKKFKPVEFLQIPMIILFSLFTDLGVDIVSPIPVNNYITQLLMVVVGVIILGFGVALSFIGNVVMNSGEALVQVISKVSNKNVGNIKIAFDVSCVVISLILALIFFGFSLQGVREGTLIAAFGTGTAVKFFRKHLKTPLNKLLEK